jgi:predicted Zn-dependent protease
MPAGRLALPIAALALCAALPACGGMAAKPPGGRTILMESPELPAEAERRQILLTRSDDVRLGREAAGQVAREVGLVDDPDLVAYVQGIGDKLLRGVPRRGFQYTFRIVDQWEPNAFALPGGYIFISRGLLVLANNEDELACVIGHEITHAAKRHAAAQQSIQAAHPMAMPWIRAQNLASYSREMEREADQGGQLLAAAAGYDPRGMATFLRSLDQFERLRVGGSRVPTFFDTHPTSTERAAVNSVRVAEIRWQRDPTLGDTRASLLRHLDGLALEQQPKGGVFVGQRFIHPDLGFSLLFPQGWGTTNSNLAVGARSPRRDASVFLTAQTSDGEPQAVAEHFVEKSREDASIEVRESKPVKIGSFDAWRMKLDVSGRGPALQVWLTFLSYRKAVWRMTGVSPAMAGDRYTPAILNTMRSFRPLQPEDLEALRYEELQVVKARPDETLIALGERTGNVWEPVRTAVYNGVFHNHRFEGGELVKIAHRVPYVPESRAPR